MREIPPERPVLIAGPTASGKSGLALQLVAEAGGVVVNADALQVYGNWRVLTARPSAEDEALVPHALYGHVAPEAEYSVGHWLREVTAILEAARAGGPRPVLVGGTGLNFTALTEGLAEIPPVPSEVRAEAEALVAAGGIGVLLGGLDARTAARIDRQNPARIRRAWEVLRTTGRGLADWQDETGPPLLPPEQAELLLVEAPPDWLSPRIERRFDAMLAGGALDEVRANLDRWDPARPASRAIGAPELVEFVQGKKTLDAAREAAIVASRQYAKRQRSWFRARMRDWTRVWAPGSDGHGI